MPRALRSLAAAAALAALGTLAAAAVPAAARAADASLTCDGYLITVGATKAQVMLRCGEPMLKETIGTTIPPARTGGEALVIERWTYDPGPGSFLRILTFHGSELVTLETGERH